MIVTVDVRPFIALTTLLAVLCGVMSCARPEPPPPPTATPSPAAAPAAASQPSPTPQTPADVGQEQHDRTLYDGPFDDATRLLIKATYTNDIEPDAAGRPVVITETLSK